MHNVNLFSRPRLFLASILERLLNEGLIGFPFTNMFLLRINCFALSKATDTAFA